MLGPQSIDETDGTGDGAAPGVKKSAEGDVSGTSGDGSRADTIRPPLTIAEMDFDGVGRGGGWRVVSGRRRLGASGSCTSGFGPTVQGC